MYLESKVVGVNMWWHCVRAYVYRNHCSNSEEGTQKQRTEGRREGGCIKRPTWAWEFGEAVCSVKMCNGAGVGFAIYVTLNLWCLFGSKHV